jgi:GGDEF domain-containing protein
MTHSAQLQQFSELQSDPLTGVGNRRAFESVMAAQFGILSHAAN